MQYRTQKINNVVPDKSKVSELSKKLGLNDKLIELLMMRGYDNADAIKVFIEPKEENFYSPFDMLGMKETVDRLKIAIENHETVAIYGDYDADGICATAILSLYLSSSCGLNVCAHIPDRLGEGYGLNKTSVENLIESFTPDLILTCDCGISAIEEVELAKDLGVDIIVTDHHEVGDAVPDCVVVNPHQKNCKYPFKELCGAGIALKLVQALGGIESGRQFYELAAIATVADIVDLKDENRLIVQLGLKQMSQSKNFGVLALLNNLKLENVTSQDIAFKIAPRINAAGRMGSAYRAFEMFTLDDQTQVAERLQEINDDNSKRKTLCDELYLQAIEMLKSYDLIHKRAIVIVNDVWEKGVTGILAARLVGDFKRPTFILVKNDDCYKGTCRSVDGINIYKILNNNADILVEYGGHNQAAGFSIKKENIEEFSRRVCDELAAWDENLFLPLSSYDMEINEEDVTKEFAESLDLLEPTGNAGNPKPLFMTKTSSLIASPLKSNYAHTILKTPNGLQLFAYNAYSLNTYYSGETERELIYEISSNGDYPPRLYLRDCGVNLLSVNDDLAKAGYLRMLNYPLASQPKYTEYNDDEVNDLVDDKFGILVIAGSKASYEKFAAYDNPNIILHEIFSTVSPNVYSRLIVSPEFPKSFLLENYNKIIFLDYPPSLNAVSYLNKRTTATIYLPKIDNRSLLFDCVSADRNVFGEYFNAIKKWNYIKAPNVFAYYKALLSHTKALKLPQFIACLSVFTQLGLVSFRPDEGVTIAKTNNALTNSEIYKTIEGWQ